MARSSNTATTSQPQVNPRLREAKAAMYADHILDVAEQMFARDGFEHTLMKGVAADAAVSLATLYSHFPAKMDLYRAVHERRIQSLTSALAVVKADPDDPLAGLLASMRVYVTFHMTHPAWLGMHLREGMAWSNDDRLLSPEQVKAWNRGLRAMAKAFTKGIEAGIFVDDEPILLARTTNAMHQVALSRWVDGGMRETPERVVEKLQHRFVRAVCVPERLPALLRAHGLRWCP